MLAFPSSHRK